jgi:hypothetical protein
VKPLNRAVVDYTAPRGACEMMITVVTTLDPRKDRRGLKQVELDTRLAEGAGHFKIVPTVQMGASFCHARGFLKSEAFPMLRS